MCLNFETRVKNKIIHIDCKIRSHVDPVLSSYLKDCCSKHGAIKRQFHDILGTSIYIKDIGCTTTAQGLILFTFSENLIEKASCWGRG